jgi:flagellin
MPSFINTNIASLNAQRNLNGSQGALQTSLQRLSSGLRINSARDDAAGMAIASRLTAQIHGSTQAGRNANDGISLSQTAEGAMSEITNNLQRIRDLAVQSRNATNSTTDRAALQAEATQLMSEVDRVAANTSFNGVRLLDGSFTGQSFQVGADAGQSVTITKLFNASSATLGVTSLANAVVGGVPAGTSTTTPVATQWGAVAAGITINGVAIGAIASASSAAERGAQVGAAINAVSGTSGVIATVDATGAVTLNNYGTVPGANTQGINIAGGAAPVADTGLPAATQTTAVAGTGFAGLDMTTAAGADKAIANMDNALSAINGARADMGALQNRFQSVVNNLQTTTENLSSSRSRIQDTDFAAETAALTRAQVLQQAGTAMLAQANQVPNGVLALLR